MNNIGKNIKTIRNAKDMTQDDLAEALFVTRQTVSNYENGRSQPDLDMLLKIAEVLETDITVIIYGPPLPQSKKDNYKWLAIGTGVTLLLGIVYWVLQNAFTSGPGLYGYRFSARLLNLLTFLPAFMFALGWSLMHILSIFSSLRQLHPQKIRIARVTTLVLLVLFMAIPLPYIVWLGVAFYRSYTYHSVSMSFPYIPVYQEAFNAIYLALEHAPFVYTILGGVFWVLGFPRVQKNREPK